MDAYTAECRKCFDTFDACHLVGHWCHVCAEMAFGGPADDYDYDADREAATCAEWDEVLP